jgi:hypothetical protein
VIAGFGDYAEPCIYAFLDAIKPVDSVSLTNKMTCAFLTYQAAAVGKIRVRTLSIQYALWNS